MSERARRFVADKLWLLIAVYTPPLTLLGGLIGDGISDAIGFIGWILLTPIFLIWGDEIAAFIFSEEDSVAETEESNGEAVAKLKRRYAEGEIDEAEFERRMDRLVALDERDEESLLADSNTTREETDTGRADQRTSNSRREREPE
jgi:uncharacterized membrane protein